MVWELGLLLCQNEAKKAASIEKAKVTCSQGVLDARVDCAKSVQEAKYNYRVAIQRAKAIRGNWFQETEVAYSKALCKAAAMKSSWSVALHREHVKLMHELKRKL